MAAQGQLQALVVSDQVVGFAGRRQFAPDQRIVGIKNVSINEPYLSRNGGGRPTLP